MNSPDLDRERVEQGIRAILLESASIEVPSRDFDLIDSGLLDSLTFVDLVFELERRFGVLLDLETLDLESLRTLASLARAVLAIGGRAGLGTPDDPG